MARVVFARNAEGTELLWQAGLQWPSHALLLFPIVGRLEDDTLRHDGKIYPMTQPDLRATSASTGSSADRVLRLTLTDSAGDVPLIRSRFR